MNRRERLMATLRGEATDRPPVNFYEVGGIRVHPEDPDPFNIYNDPSWKPLLDLAEQETDLISMTPPEMLPCPSNPREEFFETRQEIIDGSLFTFTRLRVGGKILTETVRRDPDIQTNWVIEHLLKDADDLRAYLELPDEVFSYEAGIGNLLAEEERIGDSGIVMVDTSDPICCAASLFSMQDYLMIAFSERSLFHALLEKFARQIYPVAEKVARDFPGHLWRVYGPEYATAPYLPPSLFREYVVKYTGPIVEAIQKYGGYARLHCHGRIRGVLPMILEMGASALDPIEPPPQGDIHLEEVRRDYGKDMVLFGNLEISDIENMQTDDFEKVVRASLREGTRGSGRGFVLMPTAAPYGRQISPKTLRNYQKIIEIVHAEFS